jgi:hypothetical protein
VRTLGAFALALSTIACAAQHEEGMPGDFQSYEPAGDPGSEVAAEAPAEPMAAEPEGSPERDLDQMQRELAANEAKLRALGVAVPGLEAEPRAEDANDASTKPTTTRSAEDKPAPGAQPKPSKGTKSKQDKHEREDRPSQPSKAPNIQGIAGDQAKATPLSPDGDPREQDAAGRCLMICDLSQITCELNTSICELADRHPDEDDYRSACERAAEDCEVAEEACHACVG